MSAAAAAAPLLLSSCIAVPLFPFSLSSLWSAAAKEGRHDVLCAIHHFCAGWVSWRSLSPSPSSLPVIANANPFLAMTCTVRTHGRMEGAFISARMCHAR